MRFRFILFWFLSLAQPALAQSSCDTILTLSRIDALIRDLQSGASDPDRSFDHLHRTTLRLDAATINLTLGNHPLAATRPTLSQYLASTDDIGMFWAIGQTDRAMAALAQPDFSQTALQVTRLLADHPCDGTQTGPEELIRAGLQANTIGLITSSGVSPAAAFAGSLFAAGGFALLIRRQLRRMSADQRRAKRFATSMSVALTYKGTPFEVTIVDLSCTGAKVSHNINPVLPYGAAAQLRLGGTQRDVQIVWCNAFFAGLAFKNPLSHAQLRKHLARNQAKDRTK